MQIAQVEDVYRLSPLQQDMLSDGRHRPADAPEVVQLCAWLAGPLSPGVLEEAWNRVIARHPALRTAFRTAKVRTPVQLVQRQIQFQLAVHDRRQDEEIARFLSEDRGRGFDPEQAPLLRIALLRTGPAEHLLVSTWHPLILDSWSAALVLGQVLDLSEALLRNETPAPAPPLRFRDAVDWLHGQDPGEAERFWRRELEGAAGLLRDQAAPASSGSFGARTVRLTAPATAALRSLRQEQGISLETLAHAAWALALSRRSGRNEVLFGIEASGRPAALPGAESRIGPFAQSLPWRVAVEPDAPLLAWLGRLEARRAAARPHEHVPLSRILEWGTLPSAPRFDSRVLVESLPAAVIERQGASGVSVREIRRIEPPAGPLTLLVHPGEELALQVIHDEAVFADAEVRALQDGLLALLAGFAAEPGRTVAQIAESAGGAAGAAESRHRLDAIVRLVHRRDLPPAAPEPAAAPPEKKGLGGSAIVPVARDQPLPATFYQEWALQLEGVETNSIPNALRIQGPIDVGALRRGLTEVVRRHESLRTSFRWEAGEAYLTIAPPAEVPLPVIDLSALPEERREERLPRLIAQHGGHAFDMERGPLFVAEVVRLGPRDHALLMNVHHLISDGWSVQVLQRELMILYMAFVQGRPSPLPPLQIQLTDFAHWQRRIFAGEALKAQLAWWRRTLSHLPPPPPLPIDRPRPAALAGGLVETTVALAPEAARSLRALAEATQSSLPMVLLAAVEAQLQAWSGQDDLIVSLIFAARNRPELSGQIGLFMNTVPLRVGLSGNPTFRQIAERVRDATIDAYSHQDVPFPRLLIELFPGRKLTRTILTGVCFNMLSFGDSAAAAAMGGPSLPGGLSLQTLSVEEVAVAKHDLTFTCHEAGGTVHFSLAGADDLFTAARMEEITRGFEVLLGRITADPDIPLDRLRSSFSPG